MHPCLRPLLAALLVALLPAAEKLVFKKPTLVWDGDTISTGAGWAKAGGEKPATIASAAGEAAASKVAILFHCEGEHWVRAGWRWVQTDSKLGFNAKPFSHLYVVMKTAKADVMPTDLKVLLVASGTDGKRMEGPEVSLTTHAPKVLGGGKAWLEVLVPVADLTAAKDFDPTNITEVMLVATGGKTMNCDLLIDNIGFVKAQGAGK